MPEKVSFLRGMISLSTHRSLRASGPLQVEAERRTCFWDGEKAPEAVASLLKVLVIKVRSGGRHFAALSSDGVVYTWGNGSSGQLGHGDRSNVEVPRVVEFPVGVVIVELCCASAQSAAVSKDGILFVWGWRDLEPVYKPEIVSSLSQKKVVKIELGAYHLLALTEGAGRLSEVYTWGSNDKGQLGLGHTVAQSEPVLVQSLSSMLVTDICATETSSGIITEAGEVWVWGENVDGISLGINSADHIVKKPVVIESLKGTPISQLDFGIEFGAALSATGVIYTWGKNAHGQLGVGDRANRSVPTVIQSLREFRVLGISCGNRSMMAYTICGIVFSWGNNNKNQLGHLLKDVPYFCQPKRMGIFPPSAIVYDISCGNGSLALVGAASIRINFEGRFYQEIVESEERRVADLKAEVGSKWQMEPTSFVVQDAEGQLVSQYESLRQIVLQGKSPLTLLRKESVVIKDAADLKLSFDASDLPTAKAGTPEQLLYWLTNPRYPNDQFLKDFLLTYRLFVSPRVLLESLIATYSQPDVPVKPGDPQSAHLPRQLALKRERVIDVIRCWLLEHQGDFFNSNEESTHLQTNLHRFIEEGVALRDRQVSIELTRLYHQLDPSRTHPDTYLAYAPEPSKRAHLGDISFASYPPLEVARQLSLIAFEYFSAIECKELIGQGWTKADKMTRAPNVIKMIHFSNKLSNWVSTTVLSQSSTKRKVRTYEKFVAVCQHCMDLQNYNSLLDIIGGLQSTAIFKAAKTWPNFLSSNELVQKVEQMGKTMIAHNKAGLREKIRSARPPGVPFLGMFLSDLLFIDDGNPDTTEDGMVNFRKCSLLAGTIKEIQRFQRVPFQLFPIPELKEYLTLRETNVAGVLAEVEPAEAQIAFLNNTSSTMLDREKQSDLQGERASMWMSWCEKIDAGNLFFFKKDGTNRSFLEILLESMAIQNTLQSVLVLYPQNQFELDILRRLLGHCFIPELNMESLLDLLLLAKRICLPTEVQTTLAQAISTFKNITPPVVQYPSISSFNGDNKDDEEKAIITGKRKKCNRAAIRLCEVATLMATSNDQMDVFSLLYRDLVPQSLTDLQQFVHQKKVQSSEEVQTLSSKQAQILKTCEGESPKNGGDVRNLEHQRRQLIQSLKEAEMNQENLQQKREYFQAELEKYKEKHERYYTELEQTIELNTAKLGRLGEVETMFLHFSSLIDSKGGSESSPEVAEGDIARSLSGLKNYFENQVKSMDLLSQKMDTISRDIKVMGARYGPTVSNALKHDYDLTKNAFALSLKDLDFAFETLASLADQCESFPDGHYLQDSLGRIAELRGKVITARDLILDRHLA